MQVGDLVMYCGAPAVIVRAEQWDVKVLCYGCLMWIGIDQLEAINERR